MLIVVARKKNDEEAICLKWKKGGYIYIMTNKNNTVLYVGVTSDLYKRIYEHKTHKYKQSFSERYNLDKLVYFEMLTDIETAIKREKQIKGGSRKKKEDLINSINKNWKDLYNQIELLR